LGKQIKVGGGESWHLGLGDCHVRVFYGW